MVKFGGWVLENYLSAARIFVWLYSYIDIIAADVSDLSLTNLKPQHQWTQKENHNWLLIRGQDTVGNAQHVSAEGTFMVKLSGVIVKPVSSVN
jgi:hypothetical protein